MLVDAAGISTALGRNPISERFGRFMVTGVIGGGGSAAPSHEQLMKMLRRPGFVHLALGAVARHPTLLSRELLAEQLGAVGAPGFHPALEAILNYDFLHRLGEIGCPTLVVQGTEDLLVPLGDAYEFERRIPKATTLILEDTGHVPQFERPAAFNRALLEFLGQEVAPHQPTAAESPTLRARARLAAPRQSSFAENVSHCDGSPLSWPRRNQRTRCSLVPCVNESGLIVPSPRAEAGRRRPRWPRRAPPRRRRARGPTRTLCAQTPA